MSDGMLGFVGGTGARCGGGQGRWRRLVRRRAVAQAAQSMRPHLEKLVRSQDLSAEEVEAAMNIVLDGEPTSEELASFLALLRAKKETAEEVATIAQAMRSRMVPVHAEGDVLEIIGTGRDGVNTVNISTMAAVVAAACGAKVAQHGSWSVSQRSRSTDVLKFLGIPLNLSPAGVARCIDRANIGYMFAASHHPSMDKVQPTRRALKIRTVFNLMGPLLNPAGTRRALIGVYSPDVMEIMASTLQRLGMQHALVVHTDGLDELSTVGVAQAMEVRDGKVTQTTVDPLDYELPRCELDELIGGNAEYNANVLRDLLSGKGSDTHADVVALNAGAALYVSGNARTIAEGIDLARRTIASGKAIYTLEKWVEVARDSERLS